MVCIIVDCVLSAGDIFKDEMLVKCIYELLGIVNDLQFFGEKPFGGEFDELGTD